MPEPIFEPGPVATPFVYTVSGTGEVVPRTCQAEYNGSGAGGDYIPAVIFRSQAGHVVSRAILQSTVTAGDDAEVSWFPGVKAAVAGSSTLTLAGYQVTTQSAAASIPSGAETLMSFNRGEYDPGDADLFGSGAFMANPLVWINPGIAIVTVSLSFQAGGTQRYVRLQTTNQMSFADTSIYKIPETVAIGDVASITTQVQGNATGSGAAGGAPTKLSVKVFQNSGSNKLVSGPMSITMLPSDGLRHP